MFAITAEPKQYMTYILADQEANSSVEVVPERGGIATRWQVQGQEIFYLDEERFTHPELSVRGGNPVLFPICGNLPDNTYTFNGQTYTLKQHGFARELPWQATAQSTQDGCCLTLTLTSNDQTRSVYPFDFELAFTYILRNGTLTLQQRYTNHSATVMPFSSGFHPYFRATDKTQLEVDIPGDRFLDNRTKTVQPFQGAFDFEQDEIDAAFVDVTRQTATVVDRDRQLRLRLEYSQPFSTLVFWTVKGKDFYCLEPWTAPRNAMNTGEHLLYLDPGASLELVFSMTVEPI